MILLGSVIGSVMGGMGCTAIQPAGKYGSHVECTVRMPELRELGKNNGVRMMATFKYACFWGRPARCLQRKPHWLHNETRRLSLYQIKKLSCPVGLNLA